MENKIEYLTDQKDIETHDYENFVLDFTASWCGPCQVIAPQFESLSKEKDFKHVKFYKVDVDESESLCEEYDISCMPTFIFLKDKKQIDLQTGADIKKIREKLEKHFVNEQGKEDETDMSPLPVSVVSNESVSENVVEG